MIARSYTNRRYLDALAERVLIYDGAMGTSLQAMNLSAQDFGGPQYEGCNDVLVLTKPEAVEEVHRSFLEVGVDVIETDTFRANRLTLADYGLADKVLEINRAAAALARRLADEYSTPDQPRFVAGSIGPSGKLPSADDPELSDITFDELADLFRQSAARSGRAINVFLVRSISGGGGGFRALGVAGGAAHWPSPAAMYSAHALYMLRIGTSLMPVIEVTTPLSSGSWPALRWKLTQSPPWDSSPSWTLRKLNRSSALIMVEGEFTR